MHPIRKKELEEKGMFYVLKLPAAYLSSEIVKSITKSFENAIKTHNYPSAPIMILPENSSFSVETIDKVIDEMEKKAIKDKCLLKADGMEFEISDVKITKGLK